MKKIATALIIICVLLLSACSKEKQTQTTAPQSTLEEVTAQETTAESTAVQSTSQVLTTTELSLEEFTAQSTVQPTVTALSEGEKALKKIKSEMGKSNIAVAYIGYYEGNFKSLKAQLKKEGITEKYPFIENITKSRFHSQQGCETYLIIPKEAMVLSVYEYGFDMQGNPLKGEAFAVYSDAMPFIIRGNISDIMPNFYLEGQINGKTKIKYNPCLSLENGKLQQQKGVYDFSPYELLPFFEEEK